MFETEFAASFGDCGPVGTVLPNNAYRWIDATYHRLLASRGYSHADLERLLATVGTGLIQAGAVFRAPLKAGEIVRIAVRIEEWRPKTLRLSYRGYVGARLVFEAFEVRGVFIRADGQLRAGPVEGLRRLLEGQA